MSELTIWEQIAAPLDPAQIKQKPSFYKDKTTGQRKEGKPIFFIDKTTVEERLNAICPGDWHFQVTPVVVPSSGSDGQWVVKGTLTIQGVTREDFGMNDNEEGYDPPKAAVSDALKRCAALFGLGRQLVPGHGNGETQRASATGNGKPASSRAPAPAAPVASQKPAGATQPTSELEPQRPYTPNVLRALMVVHIQDFKGENTALDRKGVQAVQIAWKGKFGGLADTEDKRHLIARFLFGITSFNQLTEAMVSAIKWWVADVTMARAEYQAILAAFGTGELWFEEEEPHAQPDAT